MSDERFRLENAQWEAAYHASEVNRCSECDEDMLGPYLANLDGTRMCCPCFAGVANRCIEDRDRAERERDLAAQLLHTERKARAHDPQ